MKLIEVLKVAYPNDNVILIDNRSGKRVWQGLSNDVYEYGKYDNWDVKGIRAGDEVLIVDIEE